jgi:hypothetical protein
VGISFKNTNTLQQPIKPKTDNNSLEQDKSRIYELTCNIWPVSLKMISTIHGATIVSTGKKDRKTNREIRVPAAIVQYNKFMKGIDRADQ